MKIKRINQNGTEIAVIETNEIIITDVQSALDLMATVRYETDCDRIATPKTAIAEDFFRLSTGVAGEILQKFIARLSSQVRQFMEKSLKRRNRVKTFSWSAVNKKKRMRKLKLVDLS